MFCAIQGAARGDGHEVRSASSWVVAVEAMPPNASPARPLRAWNAATHDFKPMFCNEALPTGSVKSNSLSLRHAARSFRFERRIVFQWCS